MWTRSIMCKKRDAREKKVGGGGRGELSARDLQCVCVRARACAVDYLDTRYFNVKYYSTFDLEQITTLCWRQGAHQVLDRNAEPTFPAVFISLRYVFVATPE